MDDENIYERLQDIFGHIPGNLSILEEQIDIDLQMEYFDFSRDFKNSVPERVMAVSNKLYEDDYSLENKKKLLVQLASLEKVEAFRAIEKYLKQPDKELRDWAVLAFQESKMLLQSKFLDEEQIFISTGLGGKGSMLRYFVVLINSLDNRFDELQQKLIRTEFDFFLKKDNAELEEVDFMENFCTLLVIVPINTSISHIFKSAINECNQYGGFIRSNFIVTNVKKLGVDEIREFISKQDDTGKK